MVTVLTVAAYFIGHYIESGVWEIAQSDDGITMAFLTLSMSEMFHSLNMRSRRHSIFTLKKQNKYLFSSNCILYTNCSCICTILLQCIQFQPISGLEFVIAIGLGALVIPIVEIVKFFQRQYDKAKGI